jgi:hypothetical protein
VTAPLPPDERERLAKMLALLDSDQAGERAAAIAAATRLLERRGLRWSEILEAVPSPLPPAVERKPQVQTWRATCAELGKRPDHLRPWERKFVADLPAFPRISVKQRYILDEIATRVLRERAA